MLLRFTGYHSQNVCFEALNGDFHGQNGLVQIRIFTAKPHLPAGGQEGRQGVIFYLAVRGRQIKRLALLKTDNLTIC